MKKKRKIVGLLLAMVMVFGMTATAWAAETKVTVTNSGPEGHTYTAYQILKGKLSKMTPEGEMEEKEYLVDIEWGNDIGDKSSDFLTELKKDPGCVKDGVNIFASAETAEDVAKALNGKGYNDGAAKAFANVADKYKGTGTPIPSGKNADLEPGYYLIVDTTPPDAKGPDGKPLLGEGDSYNAALLQVAGSNGITIADKSGAPEVDKTVKAKDDADGKPGKWTDVSIGDEVIFTLKGTLPDNYSDYETYFYEFKDTLSTGLEYVTNTAEVKLYENEAAFASDQEGTALACETKEGTEGGKKTLTWTFTNLKDNTSITADSVIVVTYKAELTINATVGGTGNPNEVKLSYTNNPNYTGDGEKKPGETPPSEAVVFTYGIDGSKTEKGSEKGLDGAKFVLYRVKKGETLSYDDNNVPQNVEYAIVENGNVTEWSTRDAAIAKPLTSAEKDGKKGKFAIKGLDQGTYYLEETEAPAGYNTLRDPIKMVVDATLGTTAEGAAKITAINIQVDEKEKEPGNTEIGTVNLKVENSAGVLLPSTGGMGTTLFYVVGAALILAAGALLVMKRRTGEGKQ